MIPTDIDINSIQSIECEFSQITPKFKEKENRINFKSKIKSVRKIILSKQQTNRDLSCPKKIPINRTLTSENINWEESKFEDLLDDFKNTLSTHKKHNKRKIDSWIKEREKNWLIQSESDFTN